MSFRKLVVVAGGAGFVGSHLVDSLVEKYDVLVIDNFCTGREENLQTAKMRAESHGSKLVCARLDVASRDLVSEIYHLVSNHFNDRKVWAYLNLACPASPVAYQSDPDGTLDTCYLGTKNALRFAAMGSRVLHASTSEVYGDPEVHPQVETYKGSVNTWGPRACYDEGKRVAETLCYESLMKGNDVRVVRIFNTYGPRMQTDDGRVVSNFIVQALRGDNITIYGDGSQTRSFCYVDDLVRGIVAYMEKDQPNRSPINLGNPVELTIDQIARAVLFKVESSSKLVHKEFPQDDPKKRKPDTTLAKKVLGWSARIGIDEGLLRTIDYFKTRIS